MSSNLTTDTVISQELDYKPLGYLHPTYRYTKITQQTGGTIVTVPATTSQESIFQIPTKAFSFAESFITGTLTPGQVAANYNYLSAKVPFANEIHLYTQGGQYMCQITNLVNYMSVVRPATTPYDQYMTNEPTDRLYPIKTIGAAPIATPDFGSRPDGTAADRPYSDIQTIITDIGAVNTALPAPQFVFRLGDIADTIFAMKKAFLFPEFIYLRVVWGPVSKFLWNSTSATNPSIGTPAVASVAATITNMQLYLACETNQDIIQSLRSKLQSSGMNIPIPYVHTNKVQVTTSTNQTVTLQIGPDKGYLVKKIYHSVFNPNENSYTCVDHSNIAGAKINNYYTQLDSVREQDYNIDCATNFDDYNLHRSMLNKTCLQTRNMYQWNWFHCADWSGLTVESKDTLTVPSENLVSGLPIQGGRQWVFAGTATSATYIHYSFIICYQNLVITPAGEIMMLKR